MARSVADCASDLKSTDAYLAFEHAMDETREQWLGERPFSASVYDRTLAGALLDELNALRFKLVDPLIKDLAGKEAAKEAQREAEDAEASAAFEHRWPIAANDGFGPEAA